MIVVFLFFKPEILYKDQNMFVKNGGLGYLSSGKTAEWEI